MKPVSLSTYKCNALCIAISYFRYLALIVLLIISPKVWAFGGDKIANNPFSFRGAELYTQSTDDGKITVFLKKYYDCGREQRAETEQVSLFETETMQARTGIELVKVSETKQENKYLQTPGHADAGCVSVILYSADIPLGPGRNEYDITWGYQLNSFDIKNIDRTKNNGFVLTVHATDGRQFRNTMPDLSALPPFVMEVNKSMSSTLAATDKENDKVTFYCSNPHSLEAVHPAVKNNDGSSPLFSEQSTLTDKGPFKPLEFINKCTAKNPVGGKVFRIDETTGMVDYQPASEPGKYLAAITIKETRDNKIISEHQCVYLIDVQQ